ncbi:MAG TPA: hypothetical protein VK452_03255 [Dissulfurispiraceae bacterium]|nr:hypothetical protein [Dissulfurispiraceae bacterium]
MYAKLKNDFDEGLNKLKFFGSLLSDRLRIEIAVFRLMHKSEELKKKRDALLQKIGGETYRMHTNSGSSHPNQEMLDAIKEIEGLEAEIKEIADKVSEISRVMA